MADGRWKVVSRWTIVFLLVSLMVAQGVFLDQYLYNYYKQHGWKSFICAYLPAVALLLWQQAVETRTGDPSTERKVKTIFKTLKQRITGYHKMFTWFLYVVPSIFQYVWILSTFADDIDSSSFFGPRFFRVILCFPSGVFLLLDTIEYAVKPELNVEWWRVFDLFDTVELLQILLVDRNTSLPINQTTKTFMLLFGSTSLCFPAFSLWELQACRKIPSETAGSNNSSFNKRTRLVSRVRIVSKVCQLLFVNLAFLVIRLVLFFDFNLDASVFVAKNVIAITVGLIEIFSACRGKRGKESQKNVNFRSTFQNPAFKTASDGSHDTSLANKITTTSSSTQTVASDFPNDKEKTIKPAELSSNDLSRRIPAFYRDPAKLLTDPCSSMPDDISFASGNTSETPLRFPSQLSSAFQKTGGQGQRYLKQNPPRKFESRICSPHVTETAKESKPLSSVLEQKKTREQEHYKKQTPFRESPVTLDSCGDSKLALSSDIGVDESNPLSSVLQPKKTRKREHYKKQTPPRESSDSLALCGDSKLALSSAIGFKESEPLSSSWQQRTTKQEKRSNAQNLRSEKLASGGDLKVRFPLDTRTDELHNLYSSRLRSTAKQEESFSGMKNFRRENPVATNPRDQLPFNTLSDELNPYSSASLDHISADNDTSEIQLGFKRFNNGPKRFSERPETEIAIPQYRRHQRKRQDSRRTGRNMHTPASTVWNARN